MNAPLTWCLATSARCHAARQCGDRRGIARIAAGEYPFACGMNMVHGLLKVEGNASAGTDKLYPLTASAEAPMLDSAEAERREAAERTKEITSLTRLVAIGTVLTLPVFIVTMLHMANSMLVPHWMVNPWLQAILITPVMFYCGHPIHASDSPHWRTAPPT